MLAIKTFSRLIGDRIYENDTEDKMRTIRMERMSEDNEWCKAEIASLTEKRAMEYGEKLQDYAKEKNHYEEQLEKVYSESDLNMVRSE